ncbi:uncharacterized protein LOC134261694 [Saccostrea cucullata]|uniref:uncharacterized protein LOC134261694 n=1 Tax=Saccostrea cuccullata TaxID=36930 RepID=UPI002ED637D4
MTMARRLQRDDTHFIVRYLCDDNLQVRTHMFFKCDSASVTLGEEYDVQWGRPKEVDRAVVIHSGTELGMRSKLKDLLSQPTSPVVSSPRSAHSPRSPTPPRPEEPPQPKRRKTEKSLTKSGRPRTTVIALGSPPPDGPTVTTLEPAENLQETAPLLSSTFLTPTRPPAILTEQTEEPAPSVTPTLLTPTRHPPTSADSSLQTSTPLIRFRTYRPSTSEEDTASMQAIMRELRDIRKSDDVFNKKVSATNTRVSGLEAQMNTILTNINILIDLVRNGGLQQPTTQAVNISELNSTDSDSASTGIPEEFQIPDAELREILRDSRNSGNFAVNLCRKLFPELYGEGNLRFDYNWFGGGKLGKKELDPRRKSVIKRYVCFFYPDLQLEENWRERIVTKINESLRRNDKRLKKSSTATLVIPTVNVDMCNDVFTFHE